MTHDCEVRELSAQAALSIRTRTPVDAMPQVFGQAFGAVAQYLEELAEEPAGPPFAAYYNMDMQDLDVEIGFPVSKTFPGKDDIKASTIPAGRFATCVHTGPYSGIEPAYNALSAWIKENGYEPVGVSYELYLNDPAETPPQELKTQILFPLKTT